MRQLLFFILFTGCLAFVLNADAQSLGSPVVSETFGAGVAVVGPALAGGVTNLDYVSSNCNVNDGQYSIVSSLPASCKPTWHAILQDHTGDTNGYFMFINASYAPSVFYTQKVSGSTLCPGTTYLFNAYIMNLIRAEVSAGVIMPNITFRIEASDGTLLATKTTGDIPAESDAKWEPYGMTFVSPNDGSDVVIKMINNAPGGNGNDLALDDITFSPYGPVIENGFTTIGNTIPQSRCAGDPVNYTLTAKQTGYNNATYQWQVNKNDGNGWANIPGQTTTTLPVSIPNAAAGTYQYRIGVLDGTKTSVNCIIYSDPLTINVYPYPVNPLAAATSACVGQPLQLSATGGDTYSWTGPNGFTSTQSNPVVTPTATLNDKGEYDVTIIKNGCPTFAKTTVTVYPSPTIAPIQPIFICEGSSQQIVTNAANTTHYKWTPSTGLDHDDVASPIASPEVTTTYQVEVSNDGCPDITATKQVIVTVWKKPQANAGQNIKIFAGQTAKLNGTAKGDHVRSYWTPYFYLDNTSSLTPTTSTPTDITYTLHILSDEGCGESTSDVFVRVYQQLTIPNTFSPNGDGINDKWNIRNLNSYPNALVSIYNRNGQPVFQSRGYPKPWDGTFNGSPLPVGTYYYVIDLQEDNLPKPSGWLLIVR